MRVVLKNASIRCASQVPPIVAPIREHLDTGRSRSSPPYFVKELRRKNLFGKAGKIFRALDNDEKLKFINGGRHSLPSALIAKKHTLFIFSALSFDVRLYPYSSAC